MSTFSVFPSDLNLARSHRDRTPRGTHRRGSRPQTRVRTTPNGLGTGTESTPEYHLVDVSDILVRETLTFININTKRVTTLYN